ncbi:MAG: glycosyltransferase family 39 protein [Lachnospiraceae bacterium]|nr:glycosyltransferase family 39 protein [Lachnospiraceae bacterium]
MTRRQYGLMFLGLVGVTVAITWLWHRFKKRNTVLFGTFLFSVVLKGLYIWYTPTYARQHDFFDFTSGQGQAAYIEWFYDHVSLPDFDPRKIWGFFQPPLHHILAAMWLRLQTLAGVSYLTACEGIQVLTLLYSVLFSIYALLLFRRNGLKGRGLELAFAVTALHPIFILFAGSLNNDTLVALFLLMSIYYGVTWAEKQNYPEIIKLALSVGCGMMTKLSEILAVPALVFLFLWVWIKGGRERFGKLLKQYLVFGAISLPLGLAYPLRNFFRFGVPLQYTPEVGEPLLGYSLWERLFDIRTVTPFASMVKNGNAFDEYNIPLAIMKTSLTGEFPFASANGYMVPFGWILLISASMLALVCLFATFMVSAGRTELKDGLLRGYYLTAYGTAVIFIINLCFKIPNFSSQDFRYIAHVTALESLYLGLLYQKSEKSGNRKITCGLITVLVLVFTAASSMVYMLLGLP